MTSFILAIGGSFQLGCVVIDLRGGSVASSAGVPFVHVVSARAPVWCGGRGLRSAFLIHCGDVEKFLTWKCYHQEGYESFN